ncbi:glutamate racemase [Synechococcus sp. PCC 7502]|uniref:glutamate racemase n=1 Tax=Synechococcus sp. PCC 7502 TaxID=1173263 RepID=UPI00029F9F6B|nr:glutamate racemase [Synechococcus sp. PCC 7502]AFY74637.1 glutamate racemase [Synechococcus sp. PCC 7502]
MVSNWQRVRSYTNQQPIGIFDSGVGGLTVLQELKRQLPNEKIVYFADTARVPWGSRPQSEIIEFVQQILSWMQTQQVKMVVMACNTSSALAIETVRSQFDLPMIGLILPAAKAAIKYGQRIGVIATTATVNSMAYVNAITETHKQSQVWQVACPEFVPLIEADRIHDPYTYEIAKNYLTPLIEAEIDTLVMGCTHYPHLLEVFKQILPPYVKFIDPAKYVVKAVNQELDILGLRDRSSRKNAVTKFYVSGDAEQFAEVSSRWLGNKPLVQNVELLPTPFTVEESSLIETAEPVELLS